MPTFNQVQLDLLRKQVAEHKELMSKVCRQAEAMLASGENLLGNIARSKLQKETKQELLDLRERYDSLTPREQQVMALAVRGLRNKQAAQQLGTAEITVKINRANVMKKMKADSFADLVRMAERIPVSPGENRG